MTPRLRTDALRVAIGARTLVDRLTLDVPAGRVCVIVGPNGAGKSTLLRTLAGLHAPAAGCVAYDGRDIAGMSARDRARLRGWMADSAQDAFPASVLETVLVGRHPLLQRWRWESAHDVEVARAALAAVGLATLAARDVSTLSSGERRRVSLAQLLAQDAPIMLLDEPSAHLDPGQQVAMLDLVRGEARAHGKALVLVLHDLHLALRYADLAVALARGSALTGHAADVLRAEVLSDVFGHPLVEIGIGSTRTLVPA